MRAYNQILCKVFVSLIMEALRKNGINSNEDKGGQDMSISS